MKYFFLSVLTLLCLAPLANAQSVTNPIWGPNWSDPTIWQGDDGKYYSVSTNPRRSIVSEDLFHWERSHTAPIDAGSWATMSSISRHYWAPDVTMVNGHRQMYISLYNSAEDSNIGVLREFAPGQFQFMGIVIRGRENKIIDTIDPELITDKKTGNVWLFFGSTGGIHRIELDKDGLRPKEGATYEHVAGLHVQHNKPRTQVFEGCYLHRRGKWWYMFVSSGNFWDHTYALKVGRARKLTDPFLDKEGNRMSEGYATPVITSAEGDRFFGPGHCGEIFKGKNKKDYIFYHCHDAEAGRKEQRPMLIQEIMWDKKGWPYVEGGKPAQEVMIP